MKNDEAKKENIEFRNYIIHYSNIRYTCNIIFNTVLSLVTLREFKPHETTMAAAAAARERDGTMDDTTVRPESQEARGKQRIYSSFRPLLNGICSK